jgi:hypothetical protein
MSRSARHKGSDVTRTPAGDFFFVVNESTQEYPICMPPLDPGEVRRVLDEARHVQAGLEHPPRGFLLFLTNGRSTVKKVVGDGALDYAVIGRHTFCDVCLLGDPQVALRQLLARPVYKTAHSGENAPPQLELRSLGARLPLVTDAGRPVSGLRASSEFVVRLGSYLLACLPLGNQHGFRENAGYRDDPRARIDQSGAFVRQPEFFAFKRKDGLTPIAELPETPDDAVAKIVLQSAHERADAWVNRRALSDGVIIGRYTDRCHSPALTTLLRRQISRIHLLLAGTPEDPVAYDLATVNGTYTRAGRVRALRLGQGDEPICLGRPPGVYLRWERISPAA